MPSDAAMRAAEAIAANDFHLFREPWDDFYVKKVAEIIDREMNTGDYGPFGGFKAHEEGSPTVIAALFPPRTAADAIHMIETTVPEGAEIVSCVVKWKKP